MSIIKTLKVWRILRRGKKEFPKGIYENIYSGNYEYNKQNDLYVDKYLNYIDEALKIDPESMIAYWEKLYLLNNTGRHKECIIVGQEMLELFKDNKYFFSTAKLLLGNCYYHVKEYKKSRDYLLDIVTSGTNLSWEKKYKEMAQVCLDELNRKKYAKYMK